MKLKIDEKDYLLEYTFEAALCEDCVQKTMSIFIGMSEASEKEGSKEMLKEVTGLPGVVVTMFYAGLLEHNPVESEKEARELLKQYFKENDGANFYGMAMDIVEQMGEDGFFKQLGITEEVEAEAKEPKQPQDHKKKVIQAKTTET